MARNLGMVTAYAYAVAGGYTGTEAEFEELLGNIADDLSQIENLSVTVTTLTPGSSATASYSNGVLALGIPRGNTGATGNGISAIIKTGTSGLVDTYTVTYTNGQTMTYTVTNGAKGDTGNGIASIALTSTSGAVKTYTVTFTDGSTFTFDVTDGEVTNASLAETLEDYAKIDGTYANLTAGTADQLNSNVRANDQSPYLFRTSGGSVDIGNREYINGIVGGTVAWNQLVQNGNFADSTGWSVYKCTPTYLNNKCTLAIGSDVSASSSITNDNGFSPVVGHKYFVGAYITSTKAIIPYYSLGSTSLYPQITATADSKTFVGAIYNQSTATSTILRMYFNPHGALADGDTVVIENFMLIDLTLLFGSTIADYIYSLEQANAGAGVAWFKKLFNKPYYAYNAGELKSVSGLVSHDMTGFNQFDKSTTIYGEYVIDSNGETASAANNARTDYIRVIPNASYYVYTEQTSGGWGAWYDADKNFISDLSGYASTVHLFTAPPNACYARMTIMRNGSGNPDTFCINLHWDGSRDGEYEPYVKHSYALDSTKTLRGKFVLDANNNLKAVGDVYPPSGEVGRNFSEPLNLGTLQWSVNSAENHTFEAPLPTLKFFASFTENVYFVSDRFIPSPTTGGAMIDHGIRQGGSSQANNKIMVKDLAYSDADAFKASVNGVYLTYLLATPTTETADPYTSPQIVDDFGTEEYVLANGTFPVPVGHNTDYPINVLAKVEMMPNSPNGNGDYIVRQTSGENEYVSLSSSTVIQNIISRLEALEG